MSRVTIFDKNTGKHIRTGSYNDPKSQDLIAQGHIDVPLSYNDKYMWDFATSTVIIDPDKAQHAADRKARKDMLRQRRTDHLAALLPTVGNSRALSQVNDALDKIIEYMEKI